MTTSANHRTADHAIDPLFLERWSPRAFAADEISQEELNRLFEAARWAPSASNAQPWRFVYARRGTPHWDRLLGLLVPFNAAWAQHAAALVFIVSKAGFVPPGKSEEIPSYSHSFDAGAAWSNLALQAVRLGWHAHGMTGFDHVRAPVELNAPAGHRVEAAIAIGRLGDKEQLPEALRARETPSQRNPIAATVFEGGFPTG